MNRPKQQAKPDMYVESGLRSLLALRDTTKFGEIKEKALVNE